ncbi:MAG TPA: glutamate--cysteine ligase, partial [Thermoanaerobaculia bacterium]|nr:glutamate--cysteine ligase [Thermoanaerobaculia bacterium]
VFSRSEYEEKILEPMYRDIEAYDPEGILRHEWLNARGAIARFERNTIEIRLLDMQECPQSDLAVAAAVMAVLEALTQERWSDLESQMAWPTERLADTLLSVIATAERTAITDREFLNAFGWTGSDTPYAGDLWRHLVEELMPVESVRHGVWREPLDLILDRGTLAHRILDALGQHFTAEALHRTYAELCRCLALNHPFSP